MTSSSTFLSTKTTGHLTSCVFVDSVQSDTEPPPQNIPVATILNLPANSNRSSAEFYEICRAFFSDRTPVDVWLDCEEGAVYDVNRVMVDAVPVMVGHSVSAGSLEIPLDSIQDLLAESANALAAPLVITNMIQAGAFPPVRSTSMEVPFPLITTNVSQVAVSEGVPKKVTFANKSYNFAHGDGANDGDVTKFDKAWTLVRYYGFIVNNNYHIEEVYDGSTARAVNWKKVFKTIGATIKVVAKVAEIVLPFLATFALTSLDARREARLRSLDSKITHLSKQPRGQKRKKQNTKAIKASKKP